MNTPASEEEPLAHLAPQEGIVSIHDGQEHHRTEALIIIVIERSTFIGLLDGDMFPVDRPTTVVKVPSRSKLAGDGFPLVLCGGHVEHLLLIFLVDGGADLRHER